MRRAIASAPGALSLGTKELGLVSSSVKRTPLTPDGVTRVLVAFRVMPMKPMVIGPAGVWKRLRPLGGKMVVPSACTTLGAGKREWPPPTALTPRRARPRYFVHAP